MIVGFLPIRSGSKSIPNKNIKNFCGFPLSYWTIEALDKCKKIDKIIVALDSKEYEATLKKYNFEKVEFYHRKSDNAQDKSSTESVMMEFLESEKAQEYSDSDLFVLVQATSPFTQSEDIEKAIKKMEKEETDSLLSGVRFKRFLWNFDGKAKNYDFRKRPRRQDFDGEFLENGAFYINKIGNIKKDRNRLSGKIATHEMEEYTSFEIDESDDWLICEELMKKHQRKRIHENLFKRKIKLFLTDVDGTLTDGGMYYGENGEMLKKFNTLDGMGLSLLKKAGIKVGLITKENTPISRKRGEKLKLDYNLIGIENKIEQIEIIRKEMGITLDEIAYIGDDINDLEAIEKCGIGAAPNDANKKVQRAAKIVLTKKGGEGCVREFADMILEYHEGK